MSLTITTNCKNYPYLKCPDKFLFDEISGHLDPQKTYVDIRQIYLKKGEVPGNGIWHYDSYNNQPENCGYNFIWVSGISLTEFIDSNQISPCTWYRYGAVLHRAKPAIEEGHRLMLRAMVLERKPKHSYIRKVDNRNNPFIDQLIKKYFK